MKLAESEESMINDDSVKGNEKLARKARTAKSRAYNGSLPDVLRLEVSPHEREIHACNILTFRAEKGLWSLCLIVRREFRVASPFGTGLSFSIFLPFYSRCIRLNVQSA
jgi:hypothetical protein